MLHAASWFRIIKHFWNRHAVAQQPAMNWHSSAIILSIMHAWCIHFTFYASISIAMTRQYLVQNWSMPKSLQRSIAEACITKIWQPTKQLCRHGTLAAYQSRAMKMNNRKWNWARDTRSRLLQDRCITVGCVPANSRFLFARRKVNTVHWHKLINSPQDQRYTTP